MSAENNPMPFEQAIKKHVVEHKLLHPLDILVVGGTGTGKSSTINALLGRQRAAVGEGVEPQTKKLAPFSLSDYFRLHDSAGLGDGGATDAEYTKDITAALNWTVGRGSFYLYMDMVLLVLDGGSRDLGTAFTLLESVILQNIAPQRVLVAINQADMSMKGHYWDYEKKEPQQPLLEFFERQAKSVKKRIMESTKMEIQEPVHFSALHGWQTQNLLQYIADNLPTGRRTIAEESKFPEWKEFYKQITAYDDKIPAFRKDDFVEALEIMRQMKRYVRHDIFEVFSSSKNSLTLESLGESVGSSIGKVLSQQLNHLKNL